MLTKSDFLKHLQCVKYLRLYKNRKDLLSKEVDANLQQTFDDSYEVESYAYKIFPDGINAGDDNIAVAISQTKKLINAETKTIFQPTVTGRNFFAGLIYYASIRKIANGIYMK